MTRLFTAKPFVVAEVGSNWQTLEHCLASIEAAKAVEADAVKFQAFDFKALYGLDIATTPCADDYLWEDEPERKGVIKLDWLPTLKAKADEVGIEFMCTAFSPELVRAVDPFVEVHKVASSDAACPFMLSAVADMKKPVLLSTGAKTNDEVIRASHLLGTKVPVVRLICVASYPADYVSLDPFITGIKGLGLSDHTLGYSVTVEAASMGAVVIEKHFTAFPELETPDRPHSLTPPQFKRMMDLIRKRPVESEEAAMFLRHNRRLIAIRDIAAGETLVLDQNYGSYRALQDEPEAIAPFDWEKAEGQRAKAPIARGRGIRLADLA